MTKRLVILSVFLTLLGCKHPYSVAKLEKIIFHSSSCFGNCPILHLELNSNKSFNLYAEKVYKKDAEPFSLNFDTSRTGYFSGQASDTSFQKLTTELVNIGLDTINFNGPIFSDGPTITLVVYYNGKRKYFQSASPTIKARKLIAALYEICETSNMKRTEGKFDIEDNKVDK